MILVQKRMYQPLMKNRLKIKRNLKYILPFCGFSVLLLVFFGVGLRTHVISDALSLINLNSASNLKYGGHNQKGQPFHIESERGTEISDKEVVFTHVKADVDLKKNETLNIEANQGVFDKTAKTIELTGNVQLKHANGLTLHTTEATIDMANGSAKNNVPIEGTNDRAHIKAKGFRMEGENQIVFLGNPELTIRAH
ncbi:MAG: LPS export ABC transporter periplasmic protein LptC [Pseudomonadota bacterium]